MPNEAIYVLKSILEGIAKLMSDIVNFLLLSAVYFAGIGSVSIIMRLFGRHFLELKMQNKKSNWHEYKVTKQPLEKYYRTF